jgi:hypothetical protein
MNVWRHPLILIATSGLVLVACKSDDDGESGAEASMTSTATDETGPADSSSGPSTSVTTSMTTDMTSVDTSATMTTDMTMTGADTTTGEPGGAAAYRFNSVAVRDPHFFAVGLDVTESQVNSQLNTALGADMTDPPDGLYDLGFVLAFNPLDESDGGGGDVIFANGQCMAQPDPISCALLPSSTEYPTTYTSQAMGTCQEADPANLTPGYDPAPQSTTGPCFLTVGADVSITTAMFSLPITNATLAARFVGDPAGNLVEGSIIGFVTQEDADAAIIDESVMFVGGMPVSALLKDSDQDMGGTGWMFHIDFTAIPAEYTG